VAGVRGHRRIAARYRARRWLAHLAAAQVIPAASRCHRAAVASIISALRPGGWLLAEEPDFVTLYASETDVVTRVVTQAVRLLETVSGGMDSQHGRRLPADLAAHGLVDVRTEGTVHQVQGGSPPPERHGRASPWKRSPIVSPPPTPSPRQSFTTRFVFSRTPLSPPTAP
jgi:hypothetical protein